MKQLVFIVFVVLMSACTKQHAFDCFTSNGKETTITRQTVPFTGIRVYDNFEIVIIQSPGQKIEISGGENVLKGIETTVENGVLTIRNMNTCNFVRGYQKKFKLVIYTPSVVDIVNEGVGVVEMDENFTQDSLSVKVGNSGDFHLNGNYRIVKTVSTGNGDMYLHGKVETLFVFTTGVNYVYAKEIMVSKYMFVHTLTLGDCSVSASNSMQFDYNIQGKGNIYLYGTPLGIRDASEPGYTGQLIQEP